MGQNPGARGQDRTRRAALVPWLTAFAALRLDGAQATLIAMAGLTYLFGCFAVTVVFNVPMNETLGGMELEEESTQSYWTGTYLPRWTFWNTVRTIACALAAALLLFGLTALPEEQPA
ncbi:anthrone oxygenase family protein [Sulfitobacter sp. 1A13421]|uniref:anthrone oxygenase family protein n=1 Tax=Sulfitobacter sp. 1A13421 TaxID=3368595 RepID=UPI00374771B3